MGFPLPCSMTSSSLRRSSVQRLRTCFYSVTCFPRLRLDSSLLVPVSFSSRLVSVHTTGFNNSGKRRKGKRREEEEEEEENRDDNRYKETPSSFPLQITTSLHLSSLERNPTPPLPPLNRSLQFQHLQLFKTSPYSYWPPFSNWHKSCPGENLGPRLKWNRERF